MTHRVRTLALLLPTVLAPLALTGCGTSSNNFRPVAEDEYAGDPRYKNADQGRLFGENGISLGIGNKGGNPADAGSGVLGVNAYLWRGALDTLSFMPLASADPFGGVIITDWYQPSSAPGERFKATAYILGRQLRADGVRVSVFRQVMNGGRWVDEPVSPATTGEIENKVLARARELRAQTTGGTAG